MYTLKVKGKEYNIRYGNEAVIRSKIVKKIVTLQNALKDADGAVVETIGNITAEILLVGLQKNHKDEFGYDYDDEESKQDALSKVYDLLDDIEDEEISLTELRNDLESEMTKNGFLAELLLTETQESKEKNPQKLKVAKKN